MASHVPEALSERLGEHATRDLVALFESSRQEWTEHVMTVAVDRFEYRLGAELSLFRVDVAREMSATREGVTREISTLREDVTGDLAALRQDVTREVGALRQDVTREIGSVGQDFTRDLAGVRVEMLKWSFLFWIGQVAAMAGLLAFMLRK